MSGVLFALFAAAFGYGTLLPLLPIYLATSGDAGLALHSGALPAVFLAAASLSAPLSGHLSDRVGRRVVVMSGCAGTMLAPVPFFLEHGLRQLYVFQAIAGVSFGAVLPTALAWLYETADPQSRPRRVAWFGTALLGGYLAGPALGGWIASGFEVAAGLPAHQAVRLALGTQAVAAAIALVAVRGWAAPVPARFGASFPGTSENAQAREVFLSLLATTLVAFTLGGFEIAAVLHLRGRLRLDSGEVAGLFVACGAAMAFSQLILLPRVPAHVSRTAWALALVAAAAALLAGLPVAVSYAATIALAAPLGGALGLAFGLLGLEMAAAAVMRRGLALGAQNAAINAGQAAGSMLGGVLFGALGERLLPGLAVAVIVLTLLLAAARSRTAARAAVRSRSGGPESPSGETSGAGRESSTPASAG